MVRETQNNDDGEVIVPESNLIMVNYGFMLGFNMIVSLIVNIVRII